MLCNAEAGQKDWENWKEFNTKNCQAQPMFWGAEAGQKDWENCKDFKRNVGLGRCIVTLKRVKKIGKTERTLKQLSGLVDVLWSEAGQKDWENWKDFIRTIGTRSIFFDVEVGQKDWKNWKEFNVDEAGQNDWENWKDFKRTVGSGW